jgi:hypothetical protein
LLYSKNLFKCKCHNVPPPSTTIKGKKEEEWVVRENKKSEANVGRVLPTCRFCIQGFNQLKTENF